MTKILFICLGNICRSPMAEFLMKELVEKAGLAGEFEIASAATCSDEIGNPVYPPIRELLTQRGISCKGKTARRVQANEYENYDLFVGMDSGNRRSLERLFQGDPKKKVSLLLDYTDHPRDVADPWYTRDFTAAERDIEEGCKALLEHLKFLHWEGKSPSPTA